MALDVAAWRAGAPLPHALVRVASLPARVVLVALVGVSFAVRWLLALPHTTPLYFPDEYIYSAIARSIADGDGIAIRGHAAAFPALLQPLLNAPFWLFEEPAVAYRLGQGLNALAMSLAAIPVYLLARRLRLSQPLALACAALALLSPDLFYVAYLLGEPIAYPLVLGALYFGVRALAEPTRGVQLGLVACSGLAAFARIQFVVLPLVFVAAALVVDRGSLRRLRLSLALFALPVVAALVAGSSRVLGYYSRVTELAVDPVALGKWAAIDLMLVAYASGWVLVPGAVAGLAWALVRPEGREDRAFAALTCFLAAALLGEATLYATNAPEIAGGGRFQERYLLTLLPLVGIGFCLWLRQGAPLRRVVAGLALVLLVVSARVPLSGYTSSTGRQDSPFLLAVHWLERHLAAGSGALLVAAVAAGLSLLAAGLAFRPRRAAPLALGAAALVFVAVGSGMLRFDAYNTSKVRASSLPADARWVDHAVTGPVTYVQTHRGPRELAFSQLFWNRSLEDVVRLPGAQTIDAFHQPVVRVARDGALLLGGEPIAGPLLVLGYGAHASFRNAERVERTPLFDLWAPRGTPQLEFLVAGRFFDGWLATAGTIEVHPRGAGTVRLPLSLPADAKQTTIRFRGDATRAVTLQPGERTTVVFEVPAGAPWRVEFEAWSPTYLPDGRNVSFRAGTPRLTRNL